MRTRHLCEHLCRGAMTKKSCSQVRRRMATPSCAYNQQDSHGYDMRKHRCLQGTSSAGAADIRYEKLQGVSLLVSVLSVRVERCAQLRCATLSVPDTVQRRRLTQRPSWLSIRANNNDEFSSPPSRPRRRLPAVPACYVMLRRALRGESRRRSQHWLQRYRHFSFYYPWTASCGGQRLILCHTTPTEPELIRCQDDVAVVTSDPD